jgi:phage terminase small subunit
VKRLNRRQSVFVEQYLQSWNASDAARKAGYKGKAGVVGPRLLADVRIKATVDARLAELKMSADEVLKRLGDQARSDMADFVGTRMDSVTKKRAVVIDLAKARRKGKLHLVKSLSETKDGLKVELYSAQEALALLGKTHRLFVDKQEISGPEGKPIEVIEVEAVKPGDDDT